jgi:hypothetical protein
MQVVTRDAEEIGRLTDIDGYLRGNGDEYGLERAMRGLAHEHRAERVTPILDQTANDEPAFRDEEPARSHELGFGDVAIVGDAGIVETTDA